MKPPEENNAPDSGLSRLAGSGYNVTAEIEGDDPQEIMGNLLALMCSACEIKQESGEYPIWISETGHGSIRVTLNSEISGG